MTTDFLQSEELRNAVLFARNRTARIFKFTGEKETGSLVHVGKVVFAIGSLELEQAMEDADGVFATVRCKAYQVEYVPGGDPSSDYFANLGLRPDRFESIGGMMDGAPVTVMTPGPGETIREFSNRVKAQAEKERAAGRNEVKARVVDPNETVTIPVPEREVRHQLTTV